MLYSKKKNTLDRSSKLPHTFIEWCKQNVSDIFNGYALETMNDLGSLLSYVNFYGIDENSLESKVIEMANQYGLIKHGKINFGVSNEKDHRK
jgi:hypothetical protein